MSAESTHSVAITQPHNEKNQDEKLRYPKRIFLIIGSEFCERFSYYGMRTVLVLYFRNFLEFSDDDSTSLYHGFAMLSYFMPLFGGIISDSYWGKYKTILILSVVYILGHLLKTLAAIPFITAAAAHISFSVIGLLLIAVGTGGIKPCVSSFGGDQFHPSQEVYRTQFFSMFYFSINCGALLAKIIMPIFRADVRCYPGYDGPKFEECYSLAFGIPGLLMILATGILVMGSSYYIKKEPSGSIFLQFCKCVVSACRNRWKTERSNRNKEHWIDYADSPARIKRDTKYVIAVLVIFSPLPIFWTLFDQQGSRWTLQALQMDRYWGGYLLKPEQMDTLNPLLILLLIPLFEATLYPFLRRYKVPFNEIRKMTAGLILAGVAFLVTASVQFGIDNTLTPLPAKNQFSVRIVNTAPCDIHMTSSQPEFHDLYVPSFQISDTAATFLQYEDDAFEISYTSNCTIDTKKLMITPSSGKILDVVINHNFSHKQDMLITKQTEGESTIASFTNAGNEDIMVTIDNTTKFALAPNNRSSISLPLGTRLYTVHAEGKLVLEETMLLQLGGLYSVYIAGTTGKYKSLQSEDLGHYKINVGWMIPQYVILTVGEVFLSITGLEFAYSQAPPSMRSVVTSFWLLTVSLGNVIVIIVAQMKAIERRAHEFILFSILIFIAAAIFMVIGKRFTPVDEKEFENDEDDDTDKRVEMEK